MQHHPTASSAPGKVLLAGGYLVLDRHHTGLVFGLDARIHVVVQETEVSRSSPSTPSQRVVVVKSPQFEGAVWRYLVGVDKRTDDGGVEVVDGASTTNNPFVQTALAYALTYIHSTNVSIPIASTSIIVLADDDYYSSQSPNISSRTTNRLNFTDFKTPLSSAHKTGLGSSAALVTAFIAAVLSHYLTRDTFNPSTDSGRILLHNLAQAAHSAAQGKVGSGFDVASAVYGSCVYRRFSPSVLTGLGEMGSAGFARRLKACVEAEWDVQVSKSKVTVPKGLRLVMCDVDCGSQTPGMVKQVLKWRAEGKQEADALWACLQRENDGLAAELVRIAEQGSDEESYAKLKEIMKSIRKLTKEMSLKSGVPIEPESQTILLDACSKVEGVIGGVIPGAGGFDAAALLIEDRQEVVDALNHLLKEWKVQSEDGTSGGRVRLLGVREEMEGAREEDVERYKDWVS